MDRDDHPAAGRPFPRRDVRGQHALHSDVNAFYSSNVLLMIPAAPPGFFGVA